MMNNFTKLFSKVFFFLLINLIGIIVLKSPVFAGGTFECTTATAVGSCALDQSTVTCTADSSPLFPDGKSCSDLSFTDCSIINRKPQPCKSSTIPPSQSAVVTTTVDCSVAPNILRAVDDTQTVKIKAYKNNISEIDHIEFYCTGPDFGPTNYSINDPQHKITDLGNGYVSIVLINDEGGSACWYQTSIRSSPKLKIKAPGNFLLCAEMSFSVQHPTCNFSINPNPPGGGQPFSVTVSGLPANATDVVLYVVKKTAGFVYVEQQSFLATNGTYPVQPRDAGDVILFQIDATLKGIRYSHVGPIIEDPFCHSAEFVIGGEPLPEPVLSGGTGSLGTTDICNFVKDPTANGECRSCFAAAGVYTPFGCIKSDPQQFVSQLLQIAIGIAGGIAFLMIVYGGMVIMTSSGNPEKLNGGKEIVYSAVAGLLLIIFSVVILKIIGVDILKIPGLS